MSRLCKSKSVRLHMDVFDPTRLIRRYGHSFCDPIGCQRNDASRSSAGVRGQAARSGNRETTREKERLAANVRNVFSSSWWRSITLCR